MRKCTQKTIKIQNIDLPMVQFYASIRKYLNVYNFMEECVAVMHIKPNLTKNI